MSEHNRQGSYRQTYVPSLKEGNPEKIKKDEDWWDKICKAHGAKNLWKKDKPKIVKNEEDTENE